MDAGPDIPFSLALSLPVATFQSVTRLSTVATTRVFPSGDKQGPGARCQGRSLSSCSSEASSYPHNLRR